MWEPPFPLVRAELAVDYKRMDGHIAAQRMRLERKLARPTKKLATSLVLNGGAPNVRAVNAIQRALWRGLVATYRYGFLSVQQELRSLRDDRATPPDLDLLPDAPTTLPRDLARQAADRIQSEATDLLRKYDAPPTSPVLLLAVVDRAERTMHNVVLELVGQVLNAGRAHAALGGKTPRFVRAAVYPARYAMRSEQLDRNTCVPCEQLHGRVVEVLDADFKTYMPPSFCLGGGRCRGIYVYGDSPSDFLEVGRQPRLPL